MLKQLVKERERKEKIMAEIYQKPEVIGNQETAEGVFMASGTQAGAPEERPAVDYGLSQTNAWDGNKQYDITFTNNSDEKVDAVSVTVKVNGNVTSIGGNVSGQINGATATITFNNYGNGIDAKTTVGPIYVAVTGTGDFSIE